MSAEFNYLSLIYTYAMLAAVSPSLEFLATIIVAIFFFSKQKKEWKISRYAMLKYDVSDNWKIIF